MRRGLCCAAVLLIALGGLCLGATETLTNRSGRPVAGVRAGFSEQVRITSFDTAVFAHQEPPGRAADFTFSNGELRNGGRFRLSWTPSTAVIVETEWLDVPPAPETPAASEPWLVASASAGGELSPLPFCLCYERLPEVACGCPGGTDLTDCEFWGREGSDVQGVRAALLEQQLLLVSVHLRASERFDGYGYIVAFRLPDRSLYVFLHPDRDGLSVEMDSGGSWSDLGVPQGALFRVDASAAWVTIPLASLAGVVSEEDLRRADVDFHLSYSEAGRRETFFYPGKGEVWYPGKPPVIPPNEWQRDPVAFDGQPVFLEEFLCGVHIGGNWGTTSTWAALLPDDYFEFLHALNTRWVGLSISLTIDDSMDASVGLCVQEQDGAYQTFSDDVLRALICRLRQEGFRVYLTLAFEQLEDSAASGKRAKRWELGHPYAYRFDSEIAEENWPWDPAHPLHEEYIAEFFSTYAHWAAYYARIAQEEGAELFSLGTETDNLMRTRTSGSAWPTEFLEEWRSVVAAVREVYDGAVTYDMLYGALVDKNPPGISYVWDDLGLDVVGVSAYFRLFEGQPDGVPTADELTASWERVFTDYLAPVRALYPTKPIVFLEFGYIDLPGASVSPAGGEYDTRVWIDTDHNGLDDGQEEQAAIYEALLRTASGMPSLLNGVFLWGHMIAPDYVWEQTFARMREISVREKLAASVVTAWYGEMGPPLDGSHQRACESPGHVSAGYGEVLMGMDWNDIPMALAWDAFPPWDCFLLDLGTGESQGTSGPDDRFGNEGIQISALRATTTQTGLAFAIEFHEEDRSSMDLRVGYLIWLGPSAYVSLHPGARSCELVNRDLPEELGEMSLHQDYLQVGPHLLGVAVTWSALQAVGLSAAEIERSSLRLEIAYRGDEFHAFIKLPGDASLSGT